MLLAASSLIQQGDIDGACRQLHDVYQRTDGLTPPPDFVTGTAAAALAQMVQDLMADLGC